MKSTLIIKIVLLFLPLIVAGVIYYNNASADGIGGGSYDLTPLYYAVISSILYFVFCMVLLMKLNRENTILLVPGALLLVAHLVYLSRVLH